MTVQSDTAKRYERILRNCETAFNHPSMLDQSHDVIGLAVITAVIWTVIIGCVVWLLI